MHLTGRHARRIAVRAQLLTARRPTSLVGMVSDLTGLQIDPIAAIAPAADLVAWTRLGDAYDPSDLRFALEIERSLVEHGSFVRPMDEIGWHVAASRAELYPGFRGWVERNDGFRRDVLAQLAAGGPLTTAEIDDTCQVPWTSSGWTNDKNVQRMVELLGLLGEVAVAGRRGRVRTWDLASRVYPFEELPDASRARTELDRRELAALGIARTGPGVEVSVEGVDGTWVVDPAALDAPASDVQGRCALLCPYDGLVQDRDRALALFDFEYVLEMYKPAAKRRWGYYALPILYGERLVGKLDAKVDRRRRVLNVRAIHEDLPWDSEVADAVEAEIDALAAWLGCEVTSSRP